MHQQPLRSAKILFSRFPIPIPLWGTQWGDGIQRSSSKLLSVTLSCSLFFYVNRSSLGFQHQIGGCCVCPVLCLRRLSVWLIHYPTIPLYPLQTTEIRTATIWTVSMHGQTNTKHIQSRNIHKHKEHTVFSNIGKRENEQPQGRKVLKLHFFPILCSTCLIQRITAQYALFIHLALTISHKIYNVFKG